MARSEKHRLAEHQVSCRDAGERAGDLSGDIDRRFAPGQTALRSVGQRDGRVEVRPEIGPNVRINATSMAPVASVLAMSAIATFPPASRSPMMPEPMTAASTKAVPRASATTRRVTALL